MKKYLSIILIGLAAVTFSSCKKDYLQELGTNPNTPSSATPPLILSAALKSAAAIPNDTYYTQYGCWMGQLSWSTNYQANVALETYDYTSGDFNVWTPLYNNLANWNALITSTTEPNFVAIGKIMTVFDFEQLVDSYNNVPYSQALQGVKILTPKYDKGSDIYDDLMKQLDAAIVLIQKAPVSAQDPGTADIYFGGDMTEWTKFANTLKLRLAIRQWDNVASKQPALKAAIAATSSLGYIDDTFEADANPGYTNSDAFGGQQSPFWLYYGSNAAGSPATYQVEFQANQFMIDFFNANNDPRLTQVYSANPSGKYVSSYFGQTAVPSGDVPSNIGPGLLKSASMNAVVMSSSESLFLQAEAVNDALITGDAASLYNKGIVASFVALEVPDAATAAAAYYTQASVAYPAGGTLEIKKKAIITQKWAALVGYGWLEVYNEYRRTGYPEVPLSKYPNVKAPNQPTRILYPTIEYQANADNVAAQGTIDKFNSTIFWAKITPVK